MMLFTFSGCSIASCPVNFDTSRKLLRIIPFLSPFVYFPLCNIHYPLNIFAYPKIPWDRTNQSKTCKHPSIIEPGCKGAAMDRDDLIWTESVIQFAINCPINDLLY
jgi:hypothetical protein